MSNVSNRHNINPFVAGKSQALTDQRLAKVGYKSTRKSPAKYKSVCVSVPQIADQSITDHSERLIPFVRSMLADAQDGIIRSLYESAGGNLSSVSDDEISVSACINYLTAEASGDRLNAQMLGDWFDAQIRDAFTVILCEQNKIEDTEDVRVVQTVNGYRGVVQSINGRNTLTPAQRMEVRNLLKACECTDSDVGAKVLSKLDEQEKVVETFKASLGFSA